VNGRDCIGRLESRGHNLVGNKTDCDFDEVNDQVGIDPLELFRTVIGELANNGGPTRTHLLFSNSPAIDAGDNSLCPATDQRGVLRPQDGDGDLQRRAVCDIGAYEAPTRPVDSFALVAHPGGRLGSDWSGARSRGNYRVVGGLLDLGMSDLTTSVGDAGDVSQLSTNDGLLDVEAGGPVYWVRDIFGTDQQAFITLVHVDPLGQHQSLLLKVQGIWQQGAIAVFYRATEGIIGIETYVPGQGWHTLATFPMTLRDGDQLGARALADGMVEAYVNGRLVGEANAGSFFVGKGGRIGLWFIVSADAMLDDFGGGTVAP
jgi:hypothetical protein